MRKFRVYYRIEFYEIPYTKGVLLPDLHSVVVELDFSKVSYRPRYWNRQFTDAIMLAEYAFKDIHEGDYRYLLHNCIMPVRVEMEGYEDFDKILMDK